MASRLKRLIRHLCITPLQLKRKFPRAVMQRIEAAVAHSEKTHAGEIRFAIELNLPLLDLMRNKSGQQRAIEVFSDLRVWDTAQNNGVLIYLLLADHDFEIVADRGIHAKVGSAGWNEISHAMESLFKAGQFEAGVLHGIAQISSVLATHYPATTHHDNELPDAPIVL